MLISSFPSLKRLASAQKLILACVNLVRSLSPTHADGISTWVASVITGRCLLNNIWQNRCYLMWVRALESGSIKVRILTETSWKWIRLSQPFPMSPLIVFCQLPCCISLLLSTFLSCPTLQVYHSLSLTPCPNIFSYPRKLWDAEENLPSLKTFRETWITLKYLKKFLFNWAIYYNFNLRCPDLYCGYQK